MKKESKPEDNEKNEKTPPGKSTVEERDGLEEPQTEAHDLDMAEAVFDPDRVQVGDNIFNFGKFSNQESKELSKPMDFSLITDIPYAFEKNEIEEKYSSLIDSGILVIHSLDYTILSYYANLICRMVIENDKGRQVRSLAIEQGPGSNEEITLIDYEKRFLNTNEVNGAQILLITDRNDYQPHEKISFFQSMMDEGHGAENFKNRMLENKHLIIYKFGGSNTWQTYQDNLNRWNFGEIWNIPFFPKILFVNYFPLHDKASDYESTIKQQRKEGKWYQEQKAFLKELLVALKTNQLDQLIKEKADKDYRLPPSTSLNIEVRDLIEKHPINPFILLVATYFRDLNLGEFNDVLTLLLEQQVALTDKVDNKKNSSRKSLLVQWQNNSDKLIRNCALECSGTNISIEKVRFIETQTRNQVLEYFQNHFAFFLLRQAEILTNSDYWLKKNFNNNSTQNLTSLVSHIATNNQDTFIKSFLKRSLANLRKERQIYVSADFKIAVIEKHLQITKSKLKNEDLSSEDLFAGLNYLHENSSIPKEQIQSLYLSIVYDGINVNAKSPDKKHEQDYRQILQKSFEKGEAKRELLTYDKERSGKAYNLILNKVIDYVTPLMYRKSLKMFILHCLREEISMETYTIDALALVSTLHKEHQEDSLKILERFLQSHREWLRRQSFLALINLIQLNTATLFKVGDWRPAKETTVIGMKDVSWLENSAVAAVIHSFRQDVESVEFKKEDGEDGLIYRLNDIIHNEVEKWGSREVPLTIFAGLPDAPNEWRNQLSILLDWLLDPITPAADLRQTEGQHFKEERYQEHLKKSLNEISWMINLWCQVLLGKCPEESYQTNSEMVNFILGHVSNHKSRSLSKSVRSCLGQQPGQYSDYIIYLKRNNKDYKQYIEKRTFVRNLTIRFDELRHKEDQLV